MLINKYLWFRQLHCIVVVIIYCTEMCMKMWNQPVRFWWRVHAVHWSAIQPLKSALCQEQSRFKLVGFQHNFVAVFWHETATVPSWICDTSSSCAACHTHLGACWPTTRPWKWRQNFSDTVLLWGKQLHCKYICKFGESIIDHSFGIKCEILEVECLTMEQTQLGLEFLGDRC